MMNRSRAGFMLLEAILTVVIVSICLTFIVQSLLTNFRTGVRFQETVRALIVMENRIDLMLATEGSDDMLTTGESLEEPYDKFTASAQVDKVDDHLKKVEEVLNWPIGTRQGQMAVTTIVYNSHEN